MFPHKKVAISILCFVQIILAQEPIRGVVQNAETGAPIIGAVSYTHLTLPTSDLV